jgi:hypothetical protein
MKNNSQLDIESYDFIKSIYDIQDTLDSPIDKALDYVFSNIDKLLVENKIETIDKILLDIDTNKTLPIVLVGILTVTDSIKEKLLNRSILYKKVEKIVKTKYNKKEATELLYDLM